MLQRYKKKINIPNYISQNCFFHADTWYSLANDVSMLVTAGMSVHKKAKRQM
jgi:hypothetical protein